MKTEKNGIILFDDSLHDDELQKTKQLIEENQRLIDELKASIKNNKNPDLWVWGLVGLFIIIGIFGIIKIMQKDVKTSAN